MNTEGIGKRRLLVHRGTENPKMDTYRRLFVAPKGSEAARLFIAPKAPAAAALGDGVDGPEPELFEECAACGDLCTQADFVTKLREGAIRRSLGVVANVERVVAARKMCRNCFLGRRPGGGVEKAAAAKESGVGGGDSGQGNSLMEDTTRQANMEHCSILKANFKSKIVLGTKVTYLYFLCI